MEPRKRCHLAASGCDRVGLDMPPDAWEYPLWVVLRQAASDPPRLESVAAGNVSGTLLEPAYEPCAVVCLRCPPERSKRYAERFGNPTLILTEDLPQRSVNVLFQE